MARAVVDILLLLGLFGFYELRHQDVGRAGASGFLLALIGLLVARSSRAIPGLDLYPVGALALVGGLACPSSRWCIQLQRWSTPRNAAPQVT